MRVLVLGTPDFGVPSLRLLKEEGFEILGVVTQPDRPAGRGNKLTACPMKQAAAELGLPVYQYEKIRAPEAVEEIRSLAPDVMITVAYGQILTRKLLAIPPMGIVNVHGSLLPKYRGPAPIQWAVYNGEKVSGVTTMLTARGVDSGDILLQEPMTIGEKETAGELFDRMAVIGAKLLIKTLRELEAGTLTPVPQKEEESTYFPMLEKEHGRLDFTLPASVLLHRIMGVSPWPGAFTDTPAGILKIWDAEVLPDINDLPGRVVCANPANGLIIACGEGALKVTRLQPPGKRAMEASDYLRGHAMAVGTVLGGSDGNA